MKKLFVVLLMGSVVAASAQVKKTTPTKPVSKTSAPVKILKTLNDSASYAIGLSVVNFYSQQGITKLNTAMLVRAINDVMGKKALLMNDEEANSCMMKLIGQKSESKAKPMIAAGEKFLAANKLKAGIKTTESGLQYEVIRQGTGVKPTASDTVEVNYAGTLIDGTEFDNSYKRGQSITFPVGGVIRGWTEALQLMPAGSKYKLFIPYQLAYGTNEAGSIPAGSTLIFEVELIKVLGKQ